MATLLTYPLPKQDSLPRWRQTLLDRLPLHADAADRYRLHFYDSFDWRLFMAGKLLEWREHNGVSELCLHDSGNDVTALTTRLDRPPPRFAADLPAGRLQRQLDKLLGVRALLPLTCVDVRSQCFRLIDEEGKTRVRLFLEQLRLAGSGGHGRILAKRLRLAPLHGYGNDAKRLTQHIEQNLALLPQAQNLLAEALSGTSKTPGDYSSGIDIPLQPEQRADAAMRRILLVLLQTMETNEAGIIDDLDTEFLHDFRVAVRRSRAALGQMKKVFPVRTLQRFRDEFAWLGSMTGPSRDLDVYLLEFSALQALLPADLRGDLEPLRDHLARHRQQEHAVLCRELQGARYRKLKQQWRRYLTSKLPQRPAAADARKPIADVAHHRTWRMYRRVLKEGNAITPESPAEEVHELRKSCKKLRYLMEFFKRLYPAREISALIKILKKLQDNLGEFQDLQVQSQAMKQFSVEMDREGRLSPQTALAMETLSDTLQDHMQRVRSEFANRFEAFGKKANRQRFERLFHPDAGAENRP
ncbi:MAG: CHAD domain-containing protein [Thiogranum sp.]|nr:CHAD domain-containing protein [Thiogranum sp.]